MAEFKEVMWQRERMCDSFVSCVICPLNALPIDETFGCVKRLRNYPKESEEIIMNWAKEHPIETIKTNADKFKEVFGVEVSSLVGYGCSGIKCPNEVGCVECEYADFWSQEYKEYKKNKSRDRLC